MSDINELDILLNYVVIISMIFSVLYSVVYLLFIIYLRRHRRDVYKYLHGIQVKSLGGFIEGIRRSCVWWSSDIFEEDEKIRRYKNILRKLNTMGYFLVALVGFLLIISLLHIVS